VKVFGGTRISMVTQMGIVGQVRGVSLDMLCRSLKMFGDVFDFT
jgi:hypothetical protein